MSSTTNQKNPKNFQEEDSLLQKLEKNGSNSKQASNTGQHSGKTNANNANTSAGGPDLAKFIELQHELKKATEKAKDWEDKALRMAAELQNSKRQNQLDMQQANKKIKKQISLSVLNFLNVLYLSFNFVPEGTDPKFVNTLQASFKQLVGDLKNKQVEVLIPEKGKSFNPEFMESLNPAGEDNPDNLVKNTVSLGLKIDNQIISPAVVNL